LKDKKFPKTIKDSSPYLVNFLNDLAGLSKVGLPWQLHFSNRGCINTIRVVVDLALRQLKVVHPSTSHSLFLSKLEHFKLAKKNFHFTKKTMLSKISAAHLKWQLPQF